MSAPKTSPNHPEHASPIPFTPTKDVERIREQVRIFSTRLRTTFEKFLKDDVQLPLWQPPSTGADQRVSRDERMGGARSRAESGSRVPADSCRSLVNGGK